MNPSPVYISPEIISIAKVQNIPPNRENILVVNILFDNESHLESDVDARSTPSTVISFSDKFVPFPFDSVQESDSFTVSFLGFVLFSDVEEAGNRKKHALVAVDITASNKSSVLHLVYAA